MYRDRGDHRRRSHSVTFKGYLTRDELNNAKSIRMKSVLTSGTLRFVTR